DSGTTGRRGQASDSLPLGWRYGDVRGYCAIHVTGGQVCRRLALARLAEVAARLLLPRRGAARENRMTDDVQDLLCQHLRPDVARLGARGDRRRATGPAGASEGRD